MENAGRQVADAAVRMLGGVEGKSAAIVAGSGNNAGDGYVTARHLALRGVEVRVFIICPPEKISGDAKINLDTIDKFGLAVEPLDSDGIKTLAGKLKKFDIVIDAVGGTGITGELRGDTAVAVGQINQAERPILAVDIPTGLDCDTGQAAGPAVRAEVTVSFVARKKGFDAPGAEKYTGRVIVADIGIDPQLIYKR